MLSLPLIVAAAQSRPSAAASQAPAAVAASLARSFGHDSIAARPRTEGAGRSAAGAPATVLGQLRQVSAATASAARSAASAYVAASAVASIAARAAASSAAAAYHASFTGSELVASWYYVSEHGAASAHTGSPDGQHESFPRHAFDSASRSFQTGFARRRQCLSGRG